MPPLFHRERLQTKHTKVALSVTIGVPMKAHPAMFTAVTLGAGVQWHEAYDAVNQYGRMMVGGASLGGSVGAAGGWLQGGGHSALSPTYGLGMVVNCRIAFMLMDPVV